jgi:uncharacterized protein (TIGR03435 family)
MRGLLVLAFVAGTVAVSAGPLAQGPEPGETFEVASIKPAPKELPLGGAPSSPDRFYRANITLQNLINYAYDMRAFRIIGGPAWISSDRWEVSAKAATALQPSQMARLVRRLLADRFALKVHTETRDLPIYHLVLARADGRLGPQMKPSELDCEPFRTGERSSRESPIDPVTTFPRCGLNFRTGPGVTTARYDGTPTTRLATLLSTTVDRFIVDKTGLSGSFDVELTYQDDRMLLPGAQQREAPALFTALQEQLGLRLESARGPVDVLVIDSANRPTPD